MTAGAILTFDKFLYLRGRLRLTTARRLLAHMSSRAPAMTATSSFFCYFIAVWASTSGGFRIISDTIVIIIFIISSSSRPTLGSKDPEG